MSEKRRFIFKQLREKVRNKYVNGTRKESWFMSIAQRKNTDDDIFSLQFIGIDQPNDRFYADPFLFERDGRHYVFFEDYRHSQRKGLLSVMEVFSVSKYSEPKVILEKDYHLSYPFVFEWNNEIYMVPETSGNRTVDLYRSTDFPFKWEFCKTLLHNVQAVDATLFAENGLWWMFVNIAPYGGTTYDDMHVYYADNPLGEWQPHALNPVVSDVRRARPAGRLFRDRGKLMRPGQDCSVRYGYGMTLNHIVALSKEEYREIPERRVLPTWSPDLLATHTINFTDKFVVIDGKKQINKI